MNKIAYMSLLAALVTGSILLNLHPAEARHFGNGVNGRQNRQHVRIQHGTYNGSLTNRESRRLNKQQSALNKQERYFRSTGDGLNNREKSVLQREQTAISKNIYQQKHDAQDTNPGPGNGIGNPAGVSLHNPPGTNWGNPPGHGTGNPPGTTWNYTGVNGRQNNQQDRIYNGVQSGELTQREYDRLQTQQESLAAKEARMRASGDGLSLTERVKLEAQQTAISKNIYQQKHDAQDTK